MNQQQIDKMTKIIAKRHRDFRNPNVAFMTTAKKTATDLCKAGYCKQSEVVENIFGEIENCLPESELQNKLAEIKKKYL